MENGIPGTVTRNKTELIKICSYKTKCLMSPVRHTRTIVLGQGKACEDVLTPITNHPPPVTVPQPPATSQQPLAAVPQSPPSSHQPPATVSQPPTTSQSTADYHGF